MSDHAERLERLEQRYQVRFAGRPRVTRDPEELEEIVAELDQVATDAPASLSEQIEALKERYANEIDEINKAQAQPYAVQAARLRMWSDLSMSRYDRSFAGQDRRTRDLGLLEEILEDLAMLRAPAKDIHDAAPGLQMDRVLSMIDQAVGVYQREAAQIRSVRRSGSQADQGTRLAQLANDQFKAYQLLFAGQSRVSRYDRSLTRIVNALQEIRLAMQSLELAGFDEPNNKNNQRLVDERLKAFRAEAAAITAAKAEAAISDRISALGGAANKVMAGYRDGYAGKSRKDVSLAGIVDLFEQLWPVAREMDEVDKAHDDDANTRNLRIVTDALAMYAEEFRQIRAAQTAGE